jgi:hypothetical protein
VTSGRQVTCCGLLPTLYGLRCSVVALRCALCHAALFRSALCRAALQFKSLLNSLLGLRRAAPHVYSAVAQHCMCHIGCFPGLFVGAFRIVNCFPFVASGITVIAL